MLEARCYTSVADQELRKVVEELLRLVSLDLAILYWLSA
jgi:hypothetical protein